MTDQEKHAAAEAHQRLQMERLRDEFAMAALNGHIVALSDVSAPSEDVWQRMVCEMAYRTADAMLTARTQEAA